MKFLPMIFITVLVLLTVVCAALVFADPAVIIMPNGQVTTVYPGTNGGPTVILPSTGQPVFVYPGGVPPVTIVPVPTVPMPTLTPPPVFETPAPMVIP